MLVDAGLSSCSWFWRQLKHITCGKIRQDQTNTEAGVKIKGQTIAVCPFYNISDGDDNMKEIPIWEKSNLTLEEASAYFNIGIGKLRELTNDESCSFVLWVGNKRLIKRRQFDAYLNTSYSI